MARNLLEEQLEAIKNQIAMLRWKRKVANESDYEEIDLKIEELNKEQTKILEELGVI